MTFPPTDSEETVDETYDYLWRRLELNPEKAAERGRRREEAERLFEELTQAPPDQQLELLRKARFRNLELLELLLETSHESQPGDPPRSEDLALLAARLAAWLGEGDPEAAAALPLAFCLAANARRLGGDPDGADALLGKAVLWLQFTSERALYSRTAGLVRWEEGRTEEAGALLLHAAQLYGLEGLAAEEGSCLALLGLLRLEEPELGNPFDALFKGWAAMDRPRRPMVALRTALSLAACQAERDQPERARCLMKEAWPLLSGIRDERELIRLYGFEGRALGCLGDREEALQILESVRRKLIEEPAPAEAALVSLDLALLLAESGRDAEIESLSAALESSFPREPALILAAGALANFGDLAMTGEPRLRQVAMDAAVTLRRTFRARRLSIKPLPFA
jgi:hypothetical protein